jgi:succinate-semialdehyde dehydrogenase/glutarate-semialdehyde dehydrogenase
MSTTTSHGPARASRLDPQLVDRLLGRVVAAPEAPTRTSRSPFGPALAEVPQSTPDDVVLAVAEARAAQPRWAARPVAERAAVLGRLHDLVLSRQSEVLDLVQLENGKARAHAYEEVADVALVARHYARRGPSYLAPRRRGSLVPGLMATTEQRRPQGVVGVISPWNYPLTLALSDALPALLAGNAVVLKPDSQTVLTALWAVDLLQQAGLPEGLVQVVVGEGPVVGTALVDAADYVCFTGSTATGRVVAARAGERLVGASLELGGKNPFYVADDAHVGLAAECAVRSVVAGSGQLCMSTERLVVHRDVHEEFMAEFLGRIEKVRLGAGLDYSAQMGSLTSQAQLDTVERHVADAVAHGARVLSGGRARPDVGPLFHEPTVLADVPRSAVCFAQETFGPVVSVHVVGSDDEAVALANDTDYGLNANVWTRDTARGHRLASRIEAGTVSVNETYTATWGSVAAPMGGMKQSGLGRRHGREGITRFTQVQTVTVQRGSRYGIGLGRVVDLPGATWTKGFTLALRAMKAAGLP